MGCPSIERCICLIHREARWTGTEWCCMCTALCSIVRMEHPCEGSTRARGAPVRGESLRGPKSPGRLRRLKHPSGVTHLWCPVAMHS